MVYNDNEMLMLSGIQHFMFCPRQWALIHIEQAWEDNLHTAEGSLLHEHADDPFYRYKNRDLRILRKVAIASKRLGLYGFSDIVECHRSEHQSSEAITLFDSEGYWIPTPIEYKRGKPKSDECDIIQVVAQAMCLEEMYSIEVKQGCIYYDTIRRRETFEITQKLKLKALELSREMHNLMTYGTIPSPKNSPKKCMKCSLYNICMPKSFKLKSVKSYIDSYLNDEETT